MPSNTPLPAAEFRRLIDGMIGVDDYGNPCLNIPEYEAYRAARAASTRTLEEHLMAEEVRTSREYDRIISSDPLPCYEVCRAAEDGWRHARSQREEHARRLAGEGGTK